MSREASAEDKTATLNGNSNGCVVNTVKDLGMVPATDNMLDILSQKDSPETSYNDLPTDPIVSDPTVGSLLHPHLYPSKNDNAEASVVDALSCFDTSNKFLVLEKLVEDDKAPLEDEELRQIGMTTAEATTNTRDVHVHNLRHDQNQIIAATSSFHINQPTHPISAVISPHHRSGTLINHDDLYHMPRIVRQSTNTFQQQQQQHTNMAERSDAGLEELIMGCNSSGNRAQTINPHPQEPEWIYWPPPDNQGHHHHQ